jgi:hypothetical protein
VLGEATRPALPAVVPELAERFLEQVRGIQALVGGQQGLEGPPAIQREIRFPNGIRQSDVFPPVPFEGSAMVS